MSYLPALEVLRGGIVESIHSAVVAVVDSDGKLIASWGSPEICLFMRSSAKPFQVLPLLEAGGVEDFGFTLREIAVMCASHIGTDDHVNTVLSLQQKVGVSEENLLCGTHQPLHAETANRLKEQGIQPTANRHNCSGKHTGMLALATLIGAPIKNYVDLDHPVQQLIFETLHRICDLEEGEISTGMDGCSVPTYALPLRAAALAFARLADPNGLPAGKAEACRKVWRAMTAHPDMVAGPGRFDTALMEAAEGVILTKGGAEGYQGISIAPGVCYEGSPAFGVALKIADGGGAGRARSIVALKVLKDLGVLSAHHMEQLSEFGPRKQTNWREITVGELRPCFQLQSST